MFGNDDSDENSEEEEKNDDVSDDESDDDSKHDDDSSKPGNSNKRNYNSIDDDDRITVTLQLPKDEVVKYLVVRGLDTTGNGCSLARRFAKDALSLDYV